jgi:hypothetical protein
LKDILIRENEKRPHGSACTAPIFPKLFLPFHRLTDTSPPLISLRSITKTHDEEAGDSTFKTINLRSFSFTEPQFAVFLNYNSRTFDTPKRYGQVR